MRGSVRCVTKAALLGAASYLVLASDFGSVASAQQSNLPPVTVDAPNQPTTRRAASRRAATGQRSTARRQAAPSAPRVDAAEAARQAQRPTGPGVGYVASRSVSSTKTDTPLLEVPQSVSVVTKQQISDQGAQTITEALRYTPGVFGDLYGVGSPFDGIKIRGFDAQRYLDGLRMPVDPGTQFAFPRVEPYGLERIEVMKGPSSALYGQTNPGGFLNMISKRPTEFARHEVEATFGSFNRYQGAFDTSGPIDKNREFLYRFVGLGRISDGQVDFTEDNKLFIAPSFTWRPTEMTKLTILSHYQDINNKGWQQYLPGGATVLANPFGRIPLTRNVGEPNSDAYRLKQAAVGYEFEHRFNNMLQFRSNLRYMNVSNDLQGVRTEGFFGLPPTATGIGPDNRSVSRSYNYVFANTQNLATDNSFQADFLTGPVRHKAVVGVDYSNLNGQSDYRVSPIASIDAFNPVYGVTFIPSAASLPSAILNNTKQTQVGAYVQDQMKFDRWTLTLTGRHDWADATLRNNGAFGSPSTVVQNDSAFTGRAGLNYVFDFGLAPYVSYSTSFMPIAGVTRLGTPFKPTQAEGPEVGIKYMPVGSNLMLTAAVFEITQKNVLTADPANVAFSVQTGEVRVQGVELEARGNLTRELEIIGGYTHLNPKVTQSNGTDLGKVMPSVPQDTASLWAKYTWFNGPVAGLGVGAGVRYVGSTFVDGANANSIPSYTLVDAAISYDFAYLRPELRGWKAQVNVFNLADTYYITNCFTGYAYCGPGQVRTVLGTLRWSWQEAATPGAGKVVK